MSFMKLRTEQYMQQANRWPQSGRHILAQFDDRAIVVYQAYRPGIAHFAAANGFFGGEFSYDRMSWIKPNFLWMMYRCGWASKEGQEAVLAVWLKREGFDQILRQAVPSTFDPLLYSTHEEWQKSLSNSDVRLQWDPDHDPHGQRLERRAIQLGLRGQALCSYGREWIVAIEDITPFVQEQHRTLLSQGAAVLTTPSEEVFSADEVVIRKLGMETAFTQKGGEP